MRHSIGYSQDLRLARGDALARPEDLSPGSQLVEASR
jgi:hypothetical protein